MRTKQCAWHERGVPTYALGKRWYHPTCPDCERKRAEGAVSESDPTPEALCSSIGPRYRLIYGNGRRLNMIRARARAVRL